MKIEDLRVGDVIQHHKVVWRLVVTSVGDGVVTLIDKAGQAVILGPFSKAFPIDSFWLVAHHKNVVLFVGDRDKLSSE